MLTVLLRHVLNTLLRHVGKVIINVTLKVFLRLVLHIFLRQVLKLDGMVIISVMSDGAPAARPEHTAKRNCHRMNILWHPTGRRNHSGAPSSVQCCIWPPVSCCFYRCCHRCVPQTSSSEAY